jgi:predicted transcriptional regulator
MKIAREVKALMMEQGTVKNRLHLKSGVNRVVINKILSGKPYNINSLHRVCKVLNAEVTITKKEKP